MNIYFERTKSGWAYKLLHSFIAVTFLFSLLIPTPGFSQTVFNLPVPGTMLSPTASFAPPLMAGMTIHPDNPLEFDFIITRGQDRLEGEAFKQESQKLINYFLAALTVPDDEMWVNLSPYEQDRIIADGLSVTEMGRDMLIQDYMLKQFTASLMYPEEELGNKFWKRIYEKTRAKFGDVEIPANTFNKVWIIPETSSVYVHGTNVFVSESHLKVMLEEDYLAQEVNQNSTAHGLGDVKSGDLQTISEQSKAVIREVILPEIEREVNHGETFANLRQIYHSMILAAWYKQNLRDSVLGHVYMDQNKVSGIDLADRQAKEKIYQQYVESFKKGVYDYIKEDYDPAAQAVIPRRYFSGGLLGNPKIKGAGRSQGAQETIGDNGVLTVNTNFDTKKRGEAGPDTSMLTYEQQEDFIKKYFLPQESWVKARVKRLFWGKKMIPQEKKRQRLYQGFMGDLEKYPLVKKELLKKPLLEMALKNYEESEYLQSDVFSLYEQVSGKMLWDKFPSGNNSGDFIRTLRGFIPDLSLNILREKDKADAVVSRSELKEMIQDWQQRVGHTMISNYYWFWEENELLLEYLIKTNMVVEDRESDSVSVNPVFAGYFAGVALKQLDQTERSLDNFADFIVPHLGSEGWQDPLRFMAMSITDEQFEAIMREFYSPDRSVDTNKPLDSLLADDGMRSAQALSDMLLSTQDLQRQAFILDTISRINRPRTIDVDKINKFINITPNDELMKQAQALLDSAKKAQGITDQDFGAPQPEAKSSAASGEAGPDTSMLTYEQQEDFIKKYFLPQESDDIEDRIQSSEKKKLFEVFMKHLEDYPSVRQELLRKPLLEMALKEYKKSRVLFSDVYLLYENLSLEMLWNFLDIRDIRREEKGSYVRFFEDLIPALSFEILKKENKADAVISREEFQGMIQSWQDEFGRTMRENPYWEKNELLLEHLVKTNMVVEDRESDSVSVNPVFAGYFSGVALKQLNQTERSLDNFAAFIVPHLGSEGWQDPLRFMEMSITDKQFEAIMIEFKDYIKKYPDICEEMFRHPELLQDQLALFSGRQWIDDTLQDIYKTSFNRMFSKENLNFIDNNKIIVNKIALEMVKQDDFQMGRDDLIGIIEEKKNALSEERASADILRSLTDDKILAPVVNGKDDSYEINPLFFGFLSGSALAEDGWNTQGNIKIVAENFGRPEWQDTIKFLSSNITDDFFDGLMEQLFNSESDLESSSNKRKALIMFIQNRREGLASFLFDILLDQNNAVGRQALILDTIARINRPQRTDVEKLQKFIDQTASEELKKRAQAFLDSAKEAQGIGGQRSDSVSKGQDQAGLATGDPQKGGIDFNPGMMELEAQGNTLDFQLDNSMLETLLPESVWGITPQIMSITPLTNVAPLLGLTDDDAQEPVQNAQDMPRPQESALEAAWNECFLEPKSTTRA